MKLLHGVGVNDSLTPVTWRVAGKKVYCPYYVRWANMLKRCYCESAIKSKPTYADKSVCKEWHVFSNFKSWMETKDWEGKHLDKDLSGSKVYSPETCHFITPELNAFVEGGQRRTTGIPAGVALSKNKQRYISRIGIGKANKYLHLGTFDTVELASKAYREKWCEIAKSHMCEDLVVNSHLLRLINENSLC